MLVFAGSLGTSPENLPVVFETTEDPSINNLTRNDINCDKTGTCYDGMFFSLTLDYVPLHIGSYRTGLGKYE